MARKSRGFSDLLAETQIQRGIEPSMQKLGKKVAKVFGQDVQMLRDQPGLATMSDALEELIRPYLEATSNRTQLEMLFSLGSVAWNMSILAKDSSQEMLDKSLLNMMKKQGLGNVEIPRFLVEKLIDRKNKLFPDNNRMIMHFDLHYAGSGQYNISVASTIPEDYSS
jgi:hypothetical protein